MDIEKAIVILKDEDCFWNSPEKDILEAINHILAERESDKKRIKDLEEENEILKFQNKQVENYVEELKKYNKTVSDRIVAYKKDSIPKQKIKDLLTEIQEEYNEVQEQFDCIWNKKSKDNYDRYKLQEFSTMQQQLGFFIGKLEEMLEDK